MSEKGRRYNKGKLRYVLFPEFAKKCIIDVYTKGAHKYSIYEDVQGNKIKGIDIPFEKRGEYKLIDDASGNWRKGLSWMETLDSINRHEEAFKAGEDFDPELMTYHAANAAWGWISILEFYKIYPQGDDRKHSYLNRPKIGLDIDGVICDFNKAYGEKYCPEGINSWHCHFDTKEHLEELTKTSDFYLNLPTLCNPKDIPFEPHCYITSRSVPEEWTKEWLFKNGFPTRPVYSIPFGASKVDIAKKAGIDIFVDDRYENFVELNNAGICTFLFDASHNQRYEVGYKRIKSLKELV
jgi:5'(3')-deoxyribonucleotidase